MRTLYSRLNIVITLILKALGQLRLDNCGLDNCGRTIAVETIAVEHNCGQTIAVEAIARNQLLYVYTLLIIQLKWFTFFNDLIVTKNLVLVHYRDPI